MPATRHYFTVYANQRGKVLKYSTVVKETLEDGMHLGCFEFGMRYDFHTCMFSILWQYYKWVYTISSCVLSSSPEHFVLRVSYCDWPLSVVVGQNWPCPGGHNFTLNYIRKTSNDFLSWTANGNLTKLNRNGPWVVLYKNCSNGSDWLHKKVTGFSICNFQTSSSMKLQCPELSYLAYSII